MDQLRAAIVRLTKAGDGTAVPLSWWRAGEGRRRDRSSAVVVAVRAAPRRRRRDRRDAAVPPAVRRDRDRAQLRRGAARGARRAAPLRAPRPRLGRRLRSTQRRDVVAGRRSSAVDRRYDRTRCRRNRRQRRPRTGPPEPPLGLRRRATNCESVARRNSHVIQRSMAAVRSHEPRRLRAARILSRISISGPSGIRTSIA